MSRRTIAGLAAVGVAILAACSPDKSPNVSLPTEASFAKTPPPPSCSFSTATTDAKNYFVNTTGQTKDQVFTLLSTMQQAYNTGGAAGATSAGFAVLARVADAATTVAVKAGAEAAGSLFVNDVLLCMNVPGFAYSATQFTAPLSVTGLFAVRSNGNTDFIIAHSGRYGAQPTTTAGWPITSGTALFYASPIGQGAFGQEALVGGTAFDIKTLPTPLKFNPQIRVGICDIPDDGTTTYARVVHVHVEGGTSTTAVLAHDDPTFCPSSFSASLNVPTSMFAAAAHELASWLTPKPAYASMMFAFKDGGGTVGGLSDIGTIAPTDTIILDRVPNASVSDTSLAQDTIPTTYQFKPNPVTVHVLTKSGKNPIGGVTINLMVIGNKGSYVANGGTAVTDASGTATFPNFYINKAGGYTISAQAADTEFGPGSFTAISNLFNINGQ